MRGICPLLQEILKQVHAIVKDRRFQQRNPALKLGINRNPTLNQPREIEEIILCAAGKAVGSACIACLSWLNRR